MTDPHHPGAAPRICSTTASLSLGLRSAAPWESIYRNFVTPAAFAGSVSGGLLDVFKKTSKTGGYVRAERSGEAESIFDAEKAKGAKDREAKAVADGISGVFSPKREPK